MTIEQAKQPLGLGDIAVRPVTYAALSILATVYLWLILYLNGQVVERVIRIENRVERSIEATQTLRVEFTELKSDTRAEFKMLHEEIRQMRVVLDEIKNAVKVRKE